MDNSIVGDTADSYVGRIAPSPSGLLHIGHASTFSIARKRFEDAAAVSNRTQSSSSSSTATAKSKLILRIEDIDLQRCRDKMYVDSIPVDLQWLGVHCTHGFGIHADTEAEAVEITPLLTLLLTPSEIKTLNTPAANNGGSECAPRSDVERSLRSYKQSDRTLLYMRTWSLLLRRGFVYPCSYSRRQIDKAISKRSDEEQCPSSHSSINMEPVFPPELRPAYMQRAPSGQNCPTEIANKIDSTNLLHMSSSTDIRSSDVTWRFRVPDDESISFIDNCLGATSFRSGKDFGDFVIWTRDGYPSYELAVVVDDAIMGITEVVRGADLLLSTARQLLLYRALGLKPPSFFHCPLVMDPKTGLKFSKRERAHSLKELRESGASPDEYYSTWW